MHYCWPQKMLGIHSDDVEVCNERCSEQCKSTTYKYNINGYKVPIWTILALMTLVTDQFLEKR